MNGSMSSLLPDLLPVYRARLAALCLTTLFHHLLIIVIIVLLLVLLHVRGTKVRRAMYSQVLQIP